MAIEFSTNSARITYVRYLDCGFELRRLGAVSYLAEIMAALEGEKGEDPDCDVIDCHIHVLLLTDVAALFHVFLLSFLTWPTIGGRLVYPYNGWPYPLSYFCA